MVQNTERSLTRDGNSSDYELKIGCHHLFKAGNSWIPGPGLCQKSREFLNLMNRSVPKSLIDYKL